jgi:hypothetical protein
MMTKASSVWGKTQNALGNSLWNKPEVQTQISQQIFSPLVLGNVNGLSGDLASAAARYCHWRVRDSTVGVTSTSHHRRRARSPNGRIPHGVDATALPNVTIVLTREIIEKTLTPSGGSNQVNEAAIKKAADAYAQMLQTIQDTFTNSGSGSPSSVPRPSNDPSPPVPPIQWNIIGPDIMAIDFQDIFKPSDWSNRGSGLGVSASPGTYDWYCKSSGNEFALSLGRGQGSPC